MPVSPRSYVVEWSGQLPIDRLLESHDPAARPAFRASEKGELESMLKRREAAGQVLIRRADGSLPDLYRLRTFAAADDALHLSLGTTDYAEYLLTNVEHPEWRAERGPEVMSDALAVCAVLVCADGSAVWGQRSKRILDSTARYHLLPSGHPEPPGDLAQGLFDELREEVGFERSEIETAEWTGFLRASSSGKPELTALLRSSLPFEEIERREREDAWEFECIHPLSWEPDVVADWLVDHAHDAVPPGHAAMLLGGSAAFGKDWKKRVEERLDDRQSSSL